MQAVPVAIILPTNQVVWGELVFEIVSGETPNKCEIPNVFQDYHPDTGEAYCENLILEKVGKFADITLYRVPNIYEPDNLVDILDFLTHNGFN